MRTLRLLVAASALALLSGSAIAASDTRTCQAGSCISRPVQLAKDCSRQKAQKDACQAKCRQNGRGNDEKCIGPCMYDWENCVNGH